MSLSRSTIRTALLLVPLLCAKATFAQLNSPQTCFEQPNGARDAIRRLPETARYWLAEDAVYIITPGERCAFLRLNTDEEREQFIGQFWYPRFVDPIPLNYDFKTEHYRRIVFANEKYGGQITGWKTDRGRIYVLFGPPDSVDLVTDQRASGKAAEQESDTHLRPTERWHYHYIKGIGEDVEFHFQFVASRSDYSLAAADQEVLDQVNLNPDPVPVTPENNSNFYVIFGRLSKIKFKDLEALLVAQIVRDQVKFSYGMRFAAATHATTLARIDIQIRCEACTHEGQVVPAVAYPVFIRISKPSGWVVDTSELTAGMAVHDRSYSGLTLIGHVDVPLTPGTYQLAIATKNTTTGDAGTLRTRFEVPAYESLEEEN
jgi:GWxTD domain-containing protein